MRRFLAVIITIGLLSVLWLPAASAEDLILGMSAQSFTAADLTELPYRLYLPEAQVPADGYAVFIHLHGIGECGVDNEAQTTTGMELVKSIMSKQGEDTIIIVPQSPEKWVNCMPSDGTYSVDKTTPSPYLVAVMELLNQMQQTYTIDANRLYVAGLSMGGYGVWDLLARYPHTFAAAIPVCGGGDPTKASLMTDVAIRTYHSADDPIVPVTGTRAMVEAVQKANGNISYTEYTNLSHSCWSRAFRATDQVSWLFSQVRTTQQPPSPPTEPPMAGDVDQNETISAADGLEVLKSVVGKVTLTDRQATAADVNMDGVVSAADALLILQYIVGKVPAL
ncbi:MAG: prolyl oligopeptidase family serine peptidase [Clostridia bacterium]|nr:prolyl oligopeptidase family serine peptidase [Clostridia bacterium]